MLIYLVGYMGSGKTTAGKKLASLLGYNFVDLDQVIETRERMSIAELFDEKGEAYFRRIEHQVVMESGQLNNSVIATGGGAPCFHNNMEVMNQAGITIYIELSPKALIDRLKGGMAKRPILKGKTPDELEQFITEALAVRAPFYKQARLVVDGISLSAETLQHALNSL